MIVQLCELCSKSQPSREFLPCWRTSLQHQGGLSLEDSMHSTNFGSHWKESSTANWKRCHQLAGLNWVSSYGLHFLGLCRSGPHVNGVGHCSFGLVDFSLWDRLWITVKKDDGCAQWEWQLTLISESQWAPNNERPGSSLKYLKPRDLFMPRLLYCFTIFQGSTLPGNGVVSMR